MVAGTANGTGPHVNRGYHSDLPMAPNDEKRGYHPVPDGRFYTKANFFTLDDQ